MENNLFLLKLDYINLLLALSLTGYVSFFYLTLFLEKTRYSIIYSVHIFTVLMWVLVMLFYRNASTPESLLIYGRLLYLAASFIPFVYYFFIQRFLNLKKSKWIQCPLFIFGLATVLLSIPTVDTVVLNSGIENEIYFNSLIVLYSTHIILFFTLAFLDLIKKYLSSSKKEKRTLFYMVVGSISSACLSGISNLILPNIGIFYFNWFGQVVSLFLVFSTGYAIIRYKLFGSKGITFVMFISFFLTTIILRAIFSNSVIDFLFNLFLFVTSSVLGYQIIKNFVLQTEQRELLANLNKQLVTQNKKIELQKTSLQELMKIKDETLHIVNHQLNTPVSVIRAAVQAYKDKIWQEGKFFDVVETELKRITETVGQFLAAKKAEDGNIKLMKTKSDFGTLVKSLIEEKKLLKKVRETNMNIALNESGNIPAIDCDIPKLTEVVSNLLDNAINYSSKDISVYLKPDKKNILLEVKDSGIGIPKSAINNLFQRFSRLENAKKTRPDGTGLGLYVCKQIVEAHGGKIWAESSGEGLGSSFFVSLPV